MNVFGYSSTNTFNGDVLMNDNLTVDGNAEIKGDLKAGSVIVDDLKTEDIYCDTIHPFTAGAQPINIVNNANQTIMNLRDNKTVDVDGKIQSIVDDLTLASASNISVCRMSDGIAEVTGAYITPRVNANELRGITSSAFDDPRITFVNNGIEFSNGSGGVIPARVEDTHFKISTYTLPENSGTSGQFLQTDGTNASWQSINALNGVVQQTIISEMPLVNPLGYWTFSQSGNMALDGNTWQNISLVSINTYPSQVQQNFTFRGSDPTATQYLQFAANTATFPQGAGSGRIVPVALCGGSSGGILYSAISKRVPINNSTSYDKITLKVAFNAPWSGLPFGLFANYVFPANAPSYPTDYFTTINTFATAQMTDVLIYGQAVQNQLTLIPAASFTNARAAICEYEFELNRSAIAISGEVNIIFSIGHSNNGLTQFQLLSPTVPYPTGSLNFTGNFGFLLARCQVIGYSVSNGAVAITSNHDLLSNLGSESHTAYLTLSGNRLMAGALQMDDHAITDVTNITSNNGAFSEISFTQPAVISYNAFSGHNFDTAANDLNYNFEIAGTNVLSLGSNGGIDNTSNLPLRMSLYPILDCQNVVKAWASIKTNSILQSYNIAACNQIATGQWNLIFNTPLNSTEYAVIVSCQFNGAFFLGTYGNRNNSDFDLHFNNLVLPADPDYWSVCVYEYP